MGWRINGSCKYLSFNMNEAGINYITGRTTKQFVSFDGDLEFALKLGGLECDWEIHKDLSVKAHTHVILSYGGHEVTRATIHLPDELFEQIYTLLSNSFFSDDIEYGMNFGGICFCPPAETSRAGLPSIAEFKDGEKLLLNEFSLSVGRQQEVD